MHTDLIPISELGPRDLAQWGELASQAMVPNPFFEPEFVLPSARAFDQRDLLVLVVRDRDAWHGALPVRRVRRWRRVPGRMLAGWIHFNCFLGTPLITGRDPEAVISAMVDRAQHDRACLVLERIDAEGELASHLAAAVGSRARPVEVDRYERALLTRRPDGDYLEQTISTRHRRELRRQLRVLTRELGELRVTERCDDPLAYELFLKMEAAGWKGEAGSAMASMPGQSVFFREMCRGFAGAGRLQLLCLGNDERTIAMRCDLLTDQGAFCFKVTFDETLRRLSPGMHLEIENMKRFHEGARQWFDSCSARDNQTMNRLWAERRRLRSIVVCPRGARHALSYAKWRAAGPILQARRERMIRQAQPQTTE